MFIVHHSKKFNGWNTIVLKPGEEYQSAGNRRCCDRTTDRYGSRSEELL